jgi:AcrR family transcriptional regulator
VAEKKPRRHYHLSRESIARAALDLVDQEGADALTLRRLADSLSVGVMNLYTYVEDKDSVVRDIVALLLAEVEVPADSDMTWEEAVIAVARSLRAMALRHPHAFIFVVLARYDEPPVVRYARRLDRTFVRLGFPRELLPKLANVLDAYTTGFLLAEAQHVALSAGDAGDPFDDDPEASALMRSRVDMNAAFEEGAKRHGLSDLLARSMEQS